VKLITTFPRHEDFDKAKAVLDRMALRYQVISPDPGFAHVGAPAIVMTHEDRLALAARGDGEFACSGWVDYYPARANVPGDHPAEFEQDVFGRAFVMVLVPCVADTRKVRIIAHISGNLTDAFPYLNAERREGCYNANGPTFTFMDRYRMISMYARRIAIAKADDIVDAWRTLEAIRRRINDVWARRAQVEPSWELREKPPALEIFKRLPRTNCRACGELTCLAFAVKVWGGEAPLSHCRPVSTGEYPQLRDALIEICAGLGVEEGVPMTGKELQ